MRSGQLVKRGLTHYNQVNDCIPIEQIETSFIATCAPVVQELTALHEVLAKERTEHETVVKGLKQELLTTNNRYCIWGYLQITTPPNTPNMCLCVCTCIRVCVVCAHALACVCMCVYAHVYAPCILQCMYVHCYQQLS